MGAVAAQPHGMRLIRATLVNVQTGLHIFTPHLVARSTHPVNPERELGCSEQRARVSVRLICETAQIHQTNALSKLERRPKHAASQSATLAAGFWKNLACSLFVDRTIPDIENF
jgi:hypothetical protein